MIRCRSIVLLSSVILCAVLSQAQESACGGGRCLEIDLPAGRCVLRVGVHDVTTGRMGTLQIPLTVGKG